MRRIGLLMLLAGCPGEVTSTPIDAPPKQVDAPDAPPGAVRTKDQLCAFWTFNEGAGSTMTFDTSGNVPVQLDIENAPGNGVFPAAFDGGDLLATQPARVVSQPTTRLGDCANTGSVTLEAWVKPANGVQGTAAEPAFIAGVAANIQERNIALLQGGSKWVGFVRTSAANADGSPQIISADAAVISGYTHLVLVADSTRRTLYVDNMPVSTGAAAAPGGWAPTYPMAIFDEYQHARQWLGRVSLVAIYSKALSTAEISTHWVLGPHAASPP